MTAVRKLWPLLVGTHRYDKSISLLRLPAGETVEAPILAYLIETTNGRILYDVGCDHAKVADPALRAKHYDPAHFPFGPPDITDEQRIEARLARLGLTPKDIDVAFLGHLHFDHAGGVGSFGCEVQVQRAELDAALSGADGGVFMDELAGHERWTVKDGDYSLVDGVDALVTPGHTAGHMSMRIVLPRGAPVLLCGDAADLTENLDAEIAPGLLWQGAPGADGRPTIGADVAEATALASIRRLKTLAAEEGAELWPNHDMGFYRRLECRCPFPDHHA
ncbi:N-acyl homoserine lactonase family protein [Derxia gummosa]|uniref:N-acyl homoserine lactonase family protein n=1 Tax=Derxia gummosa DSM 723 TaxID=1121388 RepID=A0A8B6X3L3_9BURK|nr:N-acyl homoserine lactonase family protein [Derxia gummosa]